MMLYIFQFFEHWVLGMNKKNVPSFAVCRKTKYYIIVF